MNERINPERLKLARLRRKLTYSALSEITGISTKSLAGYEKFDNLFMPTEQTTQLIADALNYPKEFFFGEEVEFVEPSTVSFRSLKSLKAADQHAAEAAGSLGVIVNSFFESKFNLPQSNLPNLRGYEPEAAAETLREIWGLGTKSISNMVHLLEANGVRVFSLAENTLKVDAFSFWKNETPYVFLNTQKSGERSRFDAAHELGHLVLHKHGSPQGRDAEDEADKFASAFLMPKRTIIASKMNFPTLDEAIRLKKNWRVSAVALIVRMKHVGILTEWQYRTLMIEANKRNLRYREIEGVERERSILIEKMLAILKQDGFKLSDLSKKLFIPIEELTNLLFMVALIQGNNGVNLKNKSTANLKIV
ncbi:XRE family transcriptional regulator [Photorhabdus khanii]|uniref:DNA-binding protein n=1 Tax=Photorhabdus khanii subsp. guanajuatensis TaxID=2100166 RepID=A0A4R4J404_9GAMM|nr:XRE family transcriptional regulator [Photorhabdus khanii]TDB48257.1 DNA-binding protein [Photorhabdus khanii subsp. guanajuatensis]